MQHDSEFQIESIIPVVSELVVNDHFGARTCGIHRTGVKTWLGRANTVQITFGYESGADQARMHGAGPAVSDRKGGRRACVCFSRKHS